MLKLAQNFPPEVGNWTLPTPNGAITDLTSFLNHGMSWLLGIIGTLAVIAVIYSGFMYLTAGGDSNQAESAKKNLAWSIIGLVLVVFSAIIIRVVNDVINTANPS